MNVTLLRLQWYLERQVWTAQRRLGPYFDTRLWTVRWHLRPDQRERCLAHLRSELDRVEAWECGGDDDAWEELGVRAGRETLEDVIAMFEARRWTDGQPLLRKMLTSAAWLRELSSVYAGDNDPQSAYLWKRQSRDLVYLVESLLAIVKEPPGTPSSSGHA